MTSPDCIIFSTLLQFCQTISENSQFSIKLGTVGKLCEYLLLSISNSFTLAKKNFMNIIYYQLSVHEFWSKVILHHSWQALEYWTPVVRDSYKIAKSWCFPCHFEIQQVCVLQNGHNIVMSALWHWHLWTFLKNSVFSIHSGIVMDSPN